MNLFRRALRLFLQLLGFICGTAVAAALYFVRQITQPERQSLWATPDEVGLTYENVRFPSQDGLNLAGWFIPAAAKDAATIIIVHGWPWNRLGDSANNLLSNIIGAKPVDLLRLAYGLHHDGFNVLMFDLRNHGQSEGLAPVTFGQEEMRDLLGALDYVSQRPEVNPQRIGTVGFSMGGNTVLYALSRTSQIKAAVAVQPTSVPVFASRFAADMFGPLAKLVLPLAELFYRLQGGPAFATMRPATAVSHAYAVPVLYIQGTGDQWGSVADVANMVAVTVNAADPIYVDTTHRFDGYQYAVDNGKLLSAFFEQHL